MEPSKRPDLITDKTLRAWLRAGPVDRGTGDGLTFVASARGAAAGKASWVLRFRFGGAAKEKVLGRYPDLSLAQAREKARSDRALIQQGINVAASQAAGPTGRAACAQRQDRAPTEVRRTEHAAGCAGHRSAAGYRLPAGPGLAGLLHPPLQAS